MDITSVGGLLLGIFAVLLGQALEGGSIMSIIQPTAALIVFGGTIGATVLGFPLRVVLQAARSVSSVFKEKNVAPDRMIEEILAFANKARREGIISLEPEMDRVKNSFLKKALTMAIDGTDPKVLKETMETELAHMEEHGEMPSKVFEAAGGFAPTIGILGAVLGLIHVMENLADPSKLGEGIAVAFVATVYGVGTANLVFLPIASKLKAKHRIEMALHEMLLQGAMSVQEGLNPRIIEEKLLAFLNEEQKARWKSKVEAAAKRKAA